MQGGKQWGNALGAVAGKGNCPTLTARFLLCWNRVLVLEKREQRHGGPTRGVPSQLLN